MRLLKYLKETTSVAGAAIENGYSGQTRVTGDPDSEIIVLTNKPEAKFNTLLGIYVASVPEMTAEDSEFKTLLKNKKILKPEERKEVMDRKCIWHNGLKGEPSPAIWKTTNATGQTRYVCNTHRAYQSKPTLKGAINAFDFIKTTA